MNAVPVLVESKQSGFGSETHDEARESTNTKLKRTASKWQADSRGGVQSSWGSDNNVFAEDFISLLDPAFRSDTKGEAVEGATRKPSISLVNENF